MFNYLTESSYNAALNRPGFAGGHFVVLSQILALRLAWVMLAGSGADELHYD
jgi:hypothetical protein